VQNHKILKLILILLPVILLVLVLAIIFIPKNSSLVSTSVKPTPTIVNPSIAPFNPSKWAGDEDVLSIESQITALENEMGNTDLRLQQILPPDLDMAIKF